MIDRDPLTSTWDPMPTDMNDVAAPVNNGNTIDRGGSVPTQPGCPFGKTKITAAETEDVEAWYSNQHPSTKIAGLQSILSVISQDQNAEASVKVWVLSFIEKQKNGFLEDINTRYGIWNTETFRLFNDTYWAIANNGYLDKAGEFYVACARALGEQIIILGNDDQQRIRDAYNEYVERGGGEVIGFEGYEVDKILNPVSNVTTGIRDLLRRHK